MMNCYEVKMLISFASIAIFGQRQASDLMGKCSAASPPSFKGSGLDIIHSNDINVWIRPYQNGFLIISFKPD